MAHVENYETYFGALMCVVTFDKETALRVAENLLRQVNSRSPNVGCNTYECGGEAELLKVVVV